MARSMPPSIAHKVLGCPAFVPGIRLCGQSLVPLLPSADRARRTHSCAMFTGWGTRTVRAFADPDQ